MFLPLLQMVMPEVRDYWLPWEGVFHNIVVVSIHKAYAGHAQKVMSGLWGQGQMSFCKAIVVVDADIDPADPQAVREQLMTRFDPREDITLTRGVLDVLDQLGRLPLPPYIEHTPTADDETRYQTVYANEPGAVAAPTAGLHFDEAMLDALDAQGIQSARVTLHVGAGTFQPVRVAGIADHRMHSERYTIPQATVDAIRDTRARGGRVVAVGTTSLRALEAAAQSGELHAGSGETDIFITPGYRFNVVDALVTNFHLPKSTLLMLVSAFAGQDTIRAAYAHAIAERYRFFSYGDAMFLEKHCLEKNPAP